MKGKLCKRYILFNYFKRDEGDLALNSLQQHLECKGFGSILKEKNISTIKSLKDAYWYDWSSSNF